MVHLLCHVRFFRYDSRAVVLVYLLVLTHVLHAQERTDNTFSDFVAAINSAHNDSRIPKKSYLINLGYGVNSKYADLNPVVSADGRTVYFARKHSPGNQGGKHDPQDIWVTTRAGDWWSPARNLGPAVNTPHADNLCGASADNRTLYFYIRNNANKGYFGFKEKTESGWSKMHQTGLEIVNESAFLESCISPDGNTILFTAKSRQNIRYQKDADERDIYVSSRSKNGSWTKPVNLGTKINTPGDEFSPFLAADGQTLYFATNGRPGYGDVDIFMARKIGPDWTDWTEPENLGPNINSSGFDGYFNLPVSGDIAYMSTSTNSFGKSDIVCFKTPENIRPASVVILQGSTLDAETSAVITANISILKVGDPSDARLHVVSSGRYTAMLEPQKTYLVKAEVPGYFPVVEVIAAPDMPAENVIGLDFRLSPFQKDKGIPLRSILFDEGKSTLKTESFASLDSIALVMLMNSKITIAISGHTDNRGDEASLLDLSRERVREVISYLKRKGVPGVRLKGKGYGSALPVAKNNTEENMKLNRRVEFRMIRW